MADARHPTPPTPPAPNAWGDAFAALPLETPTGDGWRQVSRRLDARRRRMPAWAGIAAAAGVVLAVALWTGRDTLSPRPTPSATDSAPAVAATEPVERTPPATTEEHAAGEVASATPATPAEATPTRLAAAIPATDEPDATSDAGLATLQQESARLEALLALARDDSAGSAGAVLLADAFDTRLADIDALLADQEVPADAREQLWQARVDTLRQAAGFVSTQRLLAAEGHADAWLASID